MLTWRCRRGMKELDLLMTGYLEKYYDEAQNAEQLIFEQLLELQDPELLRLLTGHVTAEDQEVQRVVEKIRGTLSA